MTAKKAAFSLRSLKPKVPQDTRVARQAVAIPLSSIPAAVTERHRPSLWDCRGCKLNIIHAVAAEFAPPVGLLTIFTKLSRQSIRFAQNVNLRVKTHRYLLTNFPFFAIMLITIIGIKGTYALLRERRVKLHKFAVFSPRTPPFIPATIHYSLSFPIWLFSRC